MAVKEFLKESKGKILDLGSGSGRNLRKIKDGEMYLVDFSKEMIKLAKEKAEQQNIKAEFKVSDIKKLSYKDDFFNAAICISALHNIKGEKNRIKSIQELYRVLKPKAKAYIGAWNIKSKRFKNKRPERLIGWTDKGKRYYYLHTEEEIHNHFKEAGFKIVEIKNSELMINFIVQKV